VYLGKSILVVVPARGGSKSIPLKNLKSFCGIPLVARVGGIIANLLEIDRAVVSTDHNGISETAVAAGIAAPFRRPDSLAGDRVGDLEVLAHALQATEQLDDRAYDIVVMLQPTSPFRKPEQVSACIRMLVEGSWDAVWTVSPTDSKSHPLKQLNVGEDGALDLHDASGAQIIARQQLEPVYHRNGIAYAFTRECLLEQKTIRGLRTGALVIEEPCVNIDTEWDLELAEFMLSRREDANG
jgi:CMP-N,N'-diacetyllegionaminic acid synthase